jgi:hypothetical protein
VCKRGYYELWTRCLHIYHALINIPDGVFFVCIKIIAAAILNIFEFLLSRQLVTQDKTANCMQNYVKQRVIAHTLIYKQHRQTTRMNGAKMSSIDRWSRINWRVWEREKERVSNARIILLSIYKSINVILLDIRHQIFIHWNFGLALLLIDRSWNRMDS